jgi:Transposase
MGRITTIGIDLAKKVFQVHGVDAESKVVVARKLRRKEVLAFFAKLPPCLVGMEACGSAHYWGREIATLGHTVKLMPPKYVKAYVKRGKTDAGDAAAICEAVTWPSMSFVPVKGLEQQGLSTLHSARSQLIGQRTQLINAVRGHLSDASSRKETCSGWPSWRRSSVTRATSACRRQHAQPWWYLCDGSRWSVLGSPPSTAHCARKTGRASWVPGSRRSPRSAR